MSEGSNQQDIVDRLKRLERFRKSPVSKERICALTQPCTKCTEHRGVRLLGMTSVVTAQLCECVDSCRVCAGSCLKPNEGSLKICTAVEPRRVVNLINQAKIPARYVSADLAKFKGFHSGDTSPRVIHHWIQNLSPGQSSGLLFSGPVGIGKSWLLAAIAKKLAFQGISVRYADFFQLVQELREAYSTEQSDRASLKPFQNVDVLIIDELGKGRNSEWELSVADSLISERYNGNKCMIAATNYPLRGSPQELARRQTDYLSHTGGLTNQMNANVFEPLSERIGSRMSSRLSENCICLEVTGQDRRKQ